MKKAYPVTLLVCVLISVLISAVQAQSPQQSLTQYISDLQKNPSDTALREKIIKHVQTMSPAPAIPFEVEKFEGRAEFAFKNAKSQSDFLDAAKEYEKALLIAPWVSAYYFNQGVAFEKAEKLQEAKQSFDLYLLAAPNAQDARDVRKRIAGLEYAIEKAAGQSSPRAIAAKKQNEFEDWLKKLDGRRYTSNDVPGAVLIIDIRGSTLVEGFRCLPGNVNCGNSYGYSYQEDRRNEIHGREVNYSIPGGPWGLQEVTITITETGNSITKRVRAPGSVTTHTFHCER